jgi:hypothetical protein
LTAKDVVEPRSKIAFTQSPLPREAPSSEDKETEAQQRISREIIIFIGSFYVTPDLIDNKGSKKSSVLL